MEKVIINSRFLLLILLIAFSPSSIATGVDVYLVYLGADKSVQKQLKADLPGNLKVKAYNAGILTMADYSGKQKAIGKLSQAKVVALVTEKPLALLENHQFKNSVVISNGDQADIDTIIAAVQ